jgi:hypothetical protein
MPNLLDIHTGGDHAVEHDAADFVPGDRFDGHAESTRVFVGYGGHRSDGRIAHEASQFRRS